VAVLIKLAFLMLVAAM